jgi:hypothetical protein
MESKDIINPDFATSTHYGEKSLTEEQLKSILQDNYLIYRMFKRAGYIESRTFPFITYATFSDDINSELDGKYNGNKSPERKKQAKKMRKIVEDYFNSIYLDGNDSLEPLEVVFIARHDNECALYNPDRFSQGEINTILQQIFSL